MKLALALAVVLTVSTNLYAYSTINRIGDTVIINEDGKQTICHEMGTMTVCN